MGAHGHPQPPRVNKLPSLLLDLAKFTPPLHYFLGDLGGSTFPHPLELPYSMHRLKRQPLVPALTEGTCSSQNKAHDLGHTYICVLSREERGFELG